MSSPIRDTQIVQTIVTAPPISVDFVTQFVQTVVTGAPSSKILVTQVVQTVVATALDISGIYFINLHKATGNHDSYNNGVERKIPDPTIKTALIGE